MTVYLVIERDQKSNKGNDAVFGAFTSKEKAEKVMYDLLENFLEAGDLYEHSVEVITLELDKPTEDYHWYMHNK